MPSKYPPIAPKCPHFLHGGDYNPDQWPPAVWQEDVRLAKLARCNAMSVGIFSWAQLEPAEGRYTFDWLDRVMDLLADNGLYAVLATPSAAHPAWMSQKYPEVLRVDANRVRRRHLGRVNYCLTSPVYRQKCAAMARRLAERYKDHPALLIWHVHNEYGGECHCELCQQAFRDWLRRRYASLDELNAAWWTAFWGHTFTDWSQIETGDACIHGMTLDWRRFVSEQTVACYLNEADALREVCPQVPVTTNTYGYFTNYVPQHWAEHLDVVSWDNYPRYHDRDDDVPVAVATSFAADFYRSMKRGRPFLMMESTPSSTNWMPVMKLKRPGVHKLSSLQAVAHGADSVQYFQWRKGRGCSEKFHGAVVDHAGHENTRVFREVAEVGEMLTKLDGVLGAGVAAQAAVLYDKENDWAIGAAAGPRARGRDYAGTCHRHYRAFWQAGVNVDVVSADADLDAYKLLAAPMLYQLRPGVAERLERFVRDGGTVVTTYWTGIADEHDLCFLGGWPGPLRDLLGLWAEEMDVLHDDEANAVVFAEGNALGLSGRYEAKTFCDLVHAEGAEVLATYAGEFYAGRPAVTVNAVGRGRAYYLASRNEQRFLNDLYDRLIDELAVPRVLGAGLPEGVTARSRSDGRREFVFVMNFTRRRREIDLGGAAFTDVLTGRATEGRLAVEPHGSVVLSR
jgi:beta-galactosidase